MASHPNTHNVKSIASAMARRKTTSKAGKGKVGKVLGEFKAGKLRSSTGATVTKRKQAIAIGLRQDTKRA